MIKPSSFLRRALIADAVFSGVAALGFTFGAGAFAPLFSLPEALLREAGLFLIAYAAFVGWLGSRQTMMKALATPARKRTVSSVSGGQSTASIPARRK